MKGYKRMKRSYMVYWQPAPDRFKTVQGVSLQRGPMDNWRCHEIQKLVPQSPLVAKKRLAPFPVYDSAANANNTVQFRPATGDNKQHVTSAVLQRVASISKYGKMRHCFACLIFFHFAVFSPPQQLQNGTVQTTR